MDNMMFLQRGDKTPNQIAFDEAKLGWATCTTEAELEAKVAMCVEIATCLDAKDPRQGFLTIMQEALEQFTPYSDKVARHFLTKGDFLTDYNRQLKGLPAKGTIYQLWKEGGHVTSVDVKFSGDIPLKYQYQSYNYETIRGKYYGSRLGYVVGD